MKLTKEERENLIEILKEYLSVFKNDKKHKRVHKREPCPKCESAKDLIKKLK